MLDTIALTLVDGVRIVVPDSLFLITPYVLREQQDFFEDELPFAREVLKPGQNVIDIGANYGVYTLPMAQTVGPSGHVWAFEPASSTAQFLARGIAENGFGQVTLEQAAMSSAPGSAQLAFHVQAELRSIVHGAAVPDGSEAVSIVTLDECMDRFGWRDIDFIKIDAEGEEPNIIKGGRRFFAALAPLVQYELRSATDMTFDLIRDFTAIGYHSYRLLPGLDALVPFDAASSPDPYLLNLFCCNAERAQRLFARGVLLRPDDLASTSETLGDTSPNEPGAQYHWRSALAHLPYAAPFVHAWEASERTAQHVAPLERFDSVTPGESVGPWILAAVLEQLERRERYSSFYAGPSALERLEVIQSLGFGSPEMARRLELVRLCIVQATAAKGRRSTVA